MSNERPQFNLSFDLQDVPWLFHSFTIARNTAMMDFSTSGKMVKARIEKCIVELKHFSPTLANYDIKEYTFFRACAALATCQKWSVYQEKPEYKYQLEHHWWKPVLFVADDMQYQLTQITLGYSPELVLSLIELFKQMAPSSAMYEEHPSIQQPLRDSIWDK